MTHRRSAPPDDPGLFVDLAARRILGGPRRRRDLDGRRHDQGGRRAAWSAGRSSPSRPPRSRSSWGTPSPRSRPTRSSRSLTTMTPPASNRPRRRKPPTPSPRPPTSTRRPRPRPRTKPFIAEDAAFGQVRVVDRAGPDRPGQGDRGHHPARDVLPDLQERPPHRPGSRVAGQAPGRQGELSRASSRPSASSRKLPGGDDRASVFRIKILTRKGSLDQALTRARQGDRRRPRGVGQEARRPARQGREPGRPEEVRRGRGAPEGRDQGFAPAEDAATQAAAHNALGDCLRAAGRPKEALYAFLHTDLLFSKDKGEHARALAQISQLWRDPQLNRPDRAEEVMERLKQEYPRSPYLGSAPR